MKLLTNKQDPRNRIIVVDAYINGDRIVCDANSDDFDLWEDCWTIEDLEDEPINPFDTKLFQDGVKREDERIMKIITDSIFYGAGVEYKDVLDYLDYLEKLKPAEVREPSNDELQRHQDELYNFKVFAAKQAKEHHISYVYDFEWNNFCAEILSYFNEQNPVKWSEEDEKTRRNLMSLLANMRGDRITEETYQKYYPWLKSLRPHWKPSEVCYGAKGDPDPAGVWKPSEKQPQVADASKMEQEVDLEKASRNVYESWMGGTMDDFLRDMVELGRVINARKEE